MSDGMDAELDALREAYRSVRAPRTLLDGIRRQRLAAERRQAIGWQRGMLATAAAALLVVGAYGVWPPAKSRPPASLTDIGVALETPVLPDAPPDRALRIAVAGTSSVAGWSLRPPRRPDLSGNREEESI